MPHLPFNRLLLVSLAVTWTFSLPGAHANSGFMNDFFQRFPDLPGFPGNNEKESFRGLYETLEYMHNKREIQPEEKDKQSDDYIETSDGGDDISSREEDNDINANIGRITGRRENSRNMAHNEEKDMMISSGPATGPPRRFKIRSRVILPQIVTPTSSLKPIFIQQPTLKPIYPLHNTIPVIRAESEQTNKDDDRLEVEPRIVPETRNLTKLKYKLIEPRPHPMIQYTSPSPLVPNNENDMKTTSGFYLFTPKPVTITPMLRDSHPMNRSLPYTKVSSLPRKVDWSNRQEFYRHPKHFQPTASPYFTTSQPYPTTPLPYPTTSIYPYQEPQPELRIIKPIDQQNEIHHELPSFFKELEDENKNLDPYHWHKLDFLKVTPEESIDMSFPDQMSFPENMPFLQSLPALPPLPSQSPPPPAPTALAQHIAAMNNLNDNHNPEVKQGIMINEKGSSGDLLKYKYSLLPQTSVEHNGNSVSTTTSRTTVTITTTVTTTTRAMTTTTSTANASNIKENDNNDNFSAEKKTLAKFRRKKPVVVRRPVKMYTRQRQLITRPKIRLEDEQPITEEFKSASQDDMIIDQGDMAIMDDDDFDSFQDMLTDYEQTSNDEKSIYKRRTIFNHFNKKSKPTYKLVSDSKPSYKAKPSYTSHNSKPKPISYDAPQYKNNQEYNAPEYNHNQLYDKPKHKYVEDITIEPVLSVKSPFGQVPYKFEDFMPIPMLSPFPFMSEEFIETVSKKIPNNNHHVGLIENWSNSAAEIKHIPDQIYYPNKPEYRPTYKPSYKPSYRPTHKPTYKPTVEPAYMSSLQPSYRNIYPRPAPESHSTVLPPVYTTPKPIHEHENEYHVPEYDNFPFKHNDYHTGHNDYNYDSNEQIDEFFSAPFPQSEYNALQFPIPYIKKPLYDQDLHRVTSKPEKMLPAFKYSTQVELPPKDSKTPKYLPHNKIIKATFFEDMKEYDEAMEDLVSENNQGWVAKPLPTSSKPDSQLVKPSIHPSYKPTYKKPLYKAPIRIKKPTGTPAPFRKAKNTLKNIISSIPRLHFPKSSPTIKSLPYSSSSIRRNDNVRNIEYSSAESKQLRPAKESKQIDYHEIDRKIRDFERNEPNEKGAFEQRDIVIVDKADHELQNSQEFSEINIVNMMEHRIMNSHTNREHANINMHKSHAILENESNNINIQRDIKILHKNEHQGNEVKERLDQLIKSKPTRDIEVIRKPEDPTIQDRLASLFNNSILKPFHMLKGIPSSESDNHPPKHHLYIEKDIPRNGKEIDSAISLEQDISNDNDTNESQNSSESQELEEVTVESEVVTDYDEIVTTTSTTYDPDKEYNDWLAEYAEQYADLFEELDSNYPENSEQEKNSKEYDFEDSFDEIDPENEGRIPPTEFTKDAKTGKKLNPVPLSSQQRYKKFLSKYKSYSQENV